MHCVSVIVVEMAVLAGAPQGKRLGIEDDSEQGPPRFEWLLYCRLFTAGFFLPLIPTSQVVGPRKRVPPRPRQIEPHAHGKC